ncbi:MAG: hypothetical protein GXO88_13890 [Chlorobi bacterium]|nr:hypothetical protein [Chlorobiota bacterium]
MKRIVEHSNSGKVFVHNNPEDFAVQLRQIIEDKDLKGDKFEDYCKKLVLEKYNWEIDSRRLVTI